MKRFLRATRLLISSPQQFVSRMRIEFLAPSTGLTRAMRRFYSIFMSVRSEPSEGNAGRLLFVYDTLVNPVTFDFLLYLYYANWLRLQSGKSHIDILLVARPNLASSRENSYVDAVGNDNIDWRLTNLIVPLSRLFPAVGRIYLVEADEAFKIVNRYQCVHPEGYGYASPKTAIVQLAVRRLNYFPALTVCDTARTIVEAYFPLADNRRIVTITLRTYDYIPARNSDIASWVEFARALDPMQYRVVFVPDASKDGVATVGQIDTFEVFDAACWNIELRAALYQRAWMNMGVASGPLTISGLMEQAHTIMIDRSLDYPADYLKNFAGITPGEKPDCFSNTCHYYLGKDDKEALMKLFNEYAQ